jgi:adenine-specific DNA-methyltransferase
MDGQSLDIKQNDIEKLREIFPNIFSEDKIDLEKFKAAFSYNINFNNEKYTLNWAGKSDAFKILQERTSATLKPQPELSVNFDSTENVFIEGENLEALKVLQKSYYNKIKCIIIDPPYNTGNDSFIYPDRFKEDLGDYEKRVGERDDEGYLMKEGLFRKNSRENGHYHSNWLNMMLPRLFLARNLLRDDGVIFVHIDDNEVHNLRLVMNEIFGEENFVGCFIWRKKSTSTNVQNATVSALTDYVLCFARTDAQCLNRRKTSVEDRKYPFTDKEGNYRTSIIEKKDAGDYARSSMKFSILGVSPRKGKRWQIGEKTAREYENRNRFLIDEGVVKLKIYDFEDDDTFSANPNLLLEHGTTDSASKYVNHELFDVPELFSNPKPVELINHLVSLGTNPDSVVLDFFAGSGTTAQAVLELNQKDDGNRKFILVQLPELCDENSEASKADYKTISDISRERIRRVIQKIETERKEKEQSSPNDIFKDQSPYPIKPIGLGFKSFKLSPSNFKVWRSEDITEENLESQLELFIDPVKPESQAENMLIELMLKSGYQLTEKIENRGNFYYINNELVIALTQMNSEIAAEIIGLLQSSEVKKVITLDRLFAGNDELKTNTALQMLDAGVEFRVV